MCSTSNSRIGEMECPICDGNGYGYFSCCTGELVNDDLPLCPECMEHLGEDKCEECNGTGLI